MRRLDRLVHLVAAHLRRDAARASASSAERGKAPWWSRVRTWWETGASSSRAAGLTVAVVSVAVVTLLIFPLERLIDATALDALYVPPVMFLAATSGVLIGLFASILGVLAFSYFHLAPVRTFRGLDSEGLAFLAVDAAAIYVATVSARARIAEERRRQEVLTRGRVVAAAEEERRRVIRDLHDGAQQPLVHAIIVLQMALGGLKDSDPDQRALVEEALQHAKQANLELRELAHGILPSALTRGGLHAGVQAVASRLTLPVEVDVAAERFPPAIEATAYFVVSEALTNVVKHAQARSAAVSARKQRAQLRVEITDDGIGGAGGTGANGLAGLEDRVSALGGKLTVDSPPGHGTRVRAFLPLSEQD